MLVTFHGRPPLAAAHHAGVYNIAACRSCDDLHGPDLECDDQEQEDHANTLRCGICRSSGGMHTAARRQREGGGVCMCAVAAEWRRVLPSCLHCDELRTLPSELLAAVQAHLALSPSLSLFLSLYLSISLSLYLSLSSRRCPPPPAPPVGVITKGMFWVLQSYSFPDCPCAPIIAVD